MTINCKGKLLDFSSPVVMGILNVTPDSFYDGGQYNDLGKVLARAEKMLAAGATILDVGGMSSRPGAKIISVEEELGRVLPIIKALASHFPAAYLSIDTIHGGVAKPAIQAGAHLINDISAAKIDSSIIDVAIETGVPYILMHMKGTPQHMQENPQYNDVVSEILTTLAHKVYELRRKGMKDIIVDPGFGFGKTVEHNYELLADLSSFKMLNAPILVGISRKSMIYKPLGSSPQEALNGTTALHMVALQQGASILRVHDVKEAVEVVKLYARLPAKQVIPNLKLKS